MKNVIKYSLILLILFPTSGYSQVKFPVKRKTERRVNNEIDGAIDKGLDGLFGGKKKKTSQKTITEEPVNEKDNTPVAGESAETLKPWSKYDFVPGDIVIFEDNLEGEQNGEFPSQWDL
ncbi:MAG: hypothetical protein KAI99_15820, partial [Cyclobacteriaceae bacterium]|nr:hypothetical protein [Cyclobacteriaceae bacterium]